MPIPICSFIRETGRRCGSPALRGQDRCHFHNRERLRRQLLATWRVNGDAHLLASMALPPLDTPEEVQICIGAVFAAIAENRIDTETRRTLIDMLRLASRNLRTAALIRHFAAKDALAAQKLDANVNANTPHSDRESGPDDSPKNSAEVSDSSESLTSAEQPEPQEADLELLAQLQSREDDRKAVAASLGDRTYICWPPKPKPKSVPVEEVQDEALTADG
jgi:hypothetical protein